MTASSDSPVVARLLREAAGDRAQVRDVVPTTAEDPLGLALGTVALPLVIGGIVTGVLAGLIAPLGLRRVGLLCWPARSSPGSSRWRSSRPGSA
jgi:hypothetical protein